MQSMEKGIWKSLSCRSECGPFDHGQQNFVCGTQPVSSLQLNVTWGLNQKTLY